MSRDTLERLLHQLSVDRATKQRFKENPDQVLARFALSDEEKVMVLEFDVASLQAAGVNPMLTMGFWQELSPQRDMRSYLRKLRPVGYNEAIHVASLKQ
jgi:protocatechuate 4,5-dioxygenase alpha chain